MNTSGRRLEPAMLWLTAAILGGAFFFQGHDVRVSLHEEYAPWAAAGAAKAVGGNLVKGLVLGSIAALGAVLLFRPGGQRLVIDSWSALLIAATVSWCLASLLWSVDRGMAARQLVVLAFCLTGAMGIARRFSPHDLAKLGFIVSGVSCLVGLAAEICLGTFRPWAAGYRFAGTLHPNGQGVQAAVLVIASCCLALRDELQWLFREGHSGYLDSLLGIGLIGTSMLLASLLIAGCVAAGRSRQAGSAGTGNSFIVGMIVLACLVSLLESGLLAASFTSLLAACCVCQIAFKVGERQATTNNGGEIAR